MAIHNADRWTHTWPAIARGNPNQVGALESYLTWDLATSAMGDWINQVTTRASEYEYTENGQQD